MGKKLLILGCSATKLKSDGYIPALGRYNGPIYKVVRKFLREREWPQDLSIGVLSAEHGLFGSLKGIEDYDKQMDKATAETISHESIPIIRKWCDGGRVPFYLPLGKNYLPAIRPGLKSLGIPHETFNGGIGEKQSQVKTFLHDTSSTPRKKAAQVEGGTGRTSYFLPDWDDLLDPKFDFEQDSFSKNTRQERGDEHCFRLMQPKQMADGVLVSLAQQGTSRGPLKRLQGTEPEALAPPRLREHFGLTDSQHLFGDCGAFSYVNEEAPTISVEQAVSLYDLYDFDFGTSVDHIPVRKISKNGELVELSDDERQDRVNTTHKYAEDFIGAAKKRKAKFNPVGAVQGLSPEQYAQSVRDYYDMGYRHLALGGLVPLKDNEIEAIVREVVAAADELKKRPWIHLFGIFRPKLQEVFRELRIDSFDSASYFRKAWLRSSQNYLGANGEWYAALRVPMTSDGRTRKRLLAADADISQLELEEQGVLKLLNQYDKDEASLNEVLDALLNYDQHLARSSETQSMRERYQRTLEQRPWRMCDCPFCQNLGIHILVFRGSNRNKRRGSHNTLMLYGSID